MSKFEANLEQLADGTWYASSPDFPDLGGSGATPVEAGENLAAQVMDHLPSVRVLVNDNLKMSDKKMAAQAIHAALEAFGVAHGRVVVLGGRPGQIEKMPHVIRDAGVTELKPGTMTAGAVLE